MQVRNRSLALLTLPVIGACADLEYVKVPTPTQYSSWNDEDQRNADAIDGVRYYLPRPFMHLKEAVPVAQRTAFVSFVITKAPGNSVYYTVDLPANAPTWLRRAVPAKISSAQALAFSTTTSAEQQSGQISDGSNSGSRTPAPPSTLKAVTGYVNETDPVTRLGELMDVVYLPDFEEQYVIRVTTGLGKAEIETRLRNGWAAEVFAQSVDNSNLIPYVIEQVEKASGAAAGIAATWASKAATGGIAPTDLGALRGSGLANQQSGEIDTAGVEKLLGDVLLFKVAEVKFAQPGLYPILKPREIAHWLGLQVVAQAGDPEATFELALKTRGLPWIRPDMAFIPCPPFTMVGFNVTTDIFFAPASRPWSLDATAKDRTGAIVSPEDTASLQEAKAAVLKALRDQRNDGPDEVIKGLPENAFTVAVAGSGQATQIAITAPQATFVAGSEQAYLTWVRNALKLDPAKTPNSKAELNENQSKLSIALDASLSTIMEVLKR